MHRLLRYASLWLVGLTTTLLAIPPANAQYTCAAPIADLTLSYDERGRPLVPVIIDDHSKVMLLDIGGGLSALEMDLVRELELPQNYSDIGMAVWTGDTSHLATQTNSFTLGAIERQDVGFMILPDYDYELGAGEPVGILALDFFAGNDLAFDFMADEFRVLPSYACAGLLEGDADENKAVLPILDSTAYYFSVPIFLDGIEIIGLLDTGAENSVLNTDLAAQLFGIDISNPDDRMTLVNNFGRYRVYERRFDELRIGDIAIAEPNFELFPNLLRGRRWETPDGEIIGPAQLIIGMDILNLFDLYLSLEAERVVFSKRVRP